MPYMINIFNIKTNNMSQNANFDIGGTVHNSHTANSKNVGLSFSLGDISPNSSWIAEGYLDTDVTDQDQIFNPSFPVSNQF
ncbi:spore germination protein [Bacillus sp. HNG]|uniref:spore germination protein n=1 Tax=unclassified Bacillus (in: firmicutes) TaxID=185979 RepID=UPI000E2FAF54|nr:spore germination protein [Bacillus sp. HNG]RFB12743.1 spore germination protein [Bacillus sp. HNG]